MKSILLVISSLVFVSNAFAKNTDLLPIKYKYEKGEIQEMSADALSYIDNSVLFLNPDQDGKHSSTFTYKAKQMADVPFLEVRAKAIGGAFKVMISQGGEWEEIGQITSERKGQWQRLKFDLSNPIEYFSDKKGLVKVKVVSLEKSKSLQIDYIGITADQTTTTAASGF